MRLCHVTTKEAAEAIRRNGFLDSERDLGGLVLRGVWFSDRPWYAGGNVDEEMLPADLACIWIDLVDALGIYFEVVNEGAPYREWCIPASLANDAIDKGGSSTPTK